MCANDDAIGRRPLGEKGGLVWMGIGTECGDGCAKCVFGECLLRNVSTHIYINVFGSSNARQPWRDLG